MSIIISVTVTRAGVAVGSTISNVQLDSMNPVQAAAYGGAESGEAPYFRYDGFMPSLIALAQGDLLTDTVNSDPLTGTNKKYRVIGDCETYPNGHTEFVCDRYIGK